MAARESKLPLNDSPRTQLFRAVDNILRSDPKLGRIFDKSGSFRSWKGESIDKQDFAQSSAPAIRITPVPEGEQYWYPGQMKGFLTIRVELLLNSFCVDDVENLFYAIQRALVPIDNTERRTMEAKLKAAQAMLGHVHFTLPAYDASPEAAADGQFRAVGLFRIEVKTT